MAKRLEQVHQDLLELLPELALTLIIFAGNLPRHFGNNTPLGYIITRYKSVPHVLQLARSCVSEQSKDQLKAKDT